MARAVPVAGGASGSNNDGSEVFIGVRKRDFIVEVKQWYETGDFYKEVKGPDLVAALTHDFARKYENPEYAKRLNVEKVVVCIMKKLDRSGTATLPRNFGKGSIDKYVREHPLKHARDKWSKKDKKLMDAVKDDIVNRASDFLRVLEKEVALEHFQAGCRKEDVRIFNEIPPAVSENDIQILYAKIEELEAVVKTKDAALGAKDAKIEEMVAQIAFITQEEMHSIQINLASFEDPFKEDDGRMEETELDGLEWLKDSPSSM